MSYRKYRVPIEIADVHSTRPADPVLDRAVTDARGGAVRGYQLPVLASGGWTAGADWAAGVLEREAQATFGRTDKALAAVGFDLDRFYYGILDPAHTDEIVVGLVSSAAEFGDPKVWSRGEWYSIEPGLLAGLEYVMLDEPMVSDLVQAMRAGACGLAIRPTQPRGWVPKANLPVIDDLGILAAGSVDHPTGVMVALPVPPEVAEQIAVPGGQDPDGLHVTLAYLGDLDEMEIDQDAVHQAVAEWARRFGPMEGKIGGQGVFDTDDGPVQYASYDCPDLPDARQSLVHRLEALGAPESGEHGYTPHITLQYGDSDIDVPTMPLNFDRVLVSYGDDDTYYPLGQPVVAAAPAPAKVYAIVDELDTSAILDLIQVKPGPRIWTRKDGQWKPDDRMLWRLQGVDPPPVVEIPADDVQSVIDQVDTFDKGLTAAAEEEFVRTQEGARRYGVAIGQRIPWGKFGKDEQARARMAKRGGQRDLPNQVEQINRQMVRNQRRRQRANQQIRQHNRKVRRQNMPLVTREDVRTEPWSMLRFGPGLGMKDEFWRRQPGGFKQWLTRFLQEQRREQRRDNRDDGPKSKYQASDSDKHDKESNEARKKAKASAAKKGPLGSQNRPDRPSWWAEVPARYRDAMRSFLNSAAKRVAGKSRDELPDSVELALRSDNRFNVVFAKQGLAESRRRDSFDRDIVEKRRRLLKSGLSPASVAAVMRTKVMNEKRRREMFERKRKLDAEAERIRRMERGEQNRRDAQRNRGRQGVAAAGTPPHSVMPAKLQAYWTGGEGAAKIRWGTGGDFDRCRRALAKYLQPQQISGACANLHRLATGQWPGKGREH